MSKERSLGEAIKRRAMEKLNLSNSERSLFGDTPVYAKPESHFTKKMGEDEYSMDLAAYHPWGSQEVVVRENPMYPKLNFENLSNLRGLAMLTPEDVLPHEMGHVLRQKIHPVSKRNLNYRNVIGEDEENYAQSFEEALRNRIAPIGELAKIERPRKSLADQYLGSSIGLSEGYW